ncbi:MAG: NUDIX hydrolase, partial [Halobacteriaceae archaeon]
MEIAVGIVETGDGIIFIHRNNTPFKDMLALPGGKVESNETPEDAMRRELAEETDMSVTDVDLIGRCTETLHEDETYTHDLHVFRAVPE